MLTRLFPPSTLLFYPMVDDAPAPKTNPHICNKAYSEVTVFSDDLSDLIATCQRHTRCSEAYCLRTRIGRQQCRLGYTKPLQPQTTMVVDEEPTLLTACSDGMIISFNPVQLSAWRANVDMQYIVSRHEVIEYCTKYVIKSEPHSQSLKDVFTNIIRSLKDGNRSLKLSRSCLSTVLVRGTTQPRKRATYFTSYQCSRTSLSLAYTDLEQLMTTLSKKGELQLHPFWTTTLYDVQHHSSIQSPSWTLLNSTPCHSCSTRAFDRCANCLVDMKLILKHMQHSSSPSITRE